MKKTVCDKCGYEAPSPSSHTDRSFYVLELKINTRYQDPLARKEWCSECTKDALGIIPVVSYEKPELDKVQALFDALVDEVAERVSDG